LGHNAVIGSLREKFKEAMTISLDNAQKKNVFQFQIVEYQAEKENEKNAKKKARH
jgi:hypothetical protein